MSIKRIVQVVELSNPAECVCNIVIACTDYMKLAQQEKTKRDEIEAWEKTTITEINAQRDQLIAHLNRSFDERAENFRYLFGVVDQAMASGNNDQLTLALHSITEIAKSTPFKELASLASVRTALSDPDHNWTF